MSASTESGTVIALPVARDVVSPGLVELLAEVRAVPTEPVAVEPEPSFEDELVAQELALAGESAALRDRAHRFAAAVEAGAVVDFDAIASVLDAIRSYQPFLDFRDRRLNASAYRRLAGVGARTHHQVA